MACRRTGGVVLPPDRQPVKKEPDARSCPNGCVAPSWDAVFLRMHTRWAVRLPKHST